MTLSDFIEANLSDLIEDWIEHARVLSPEELHLTERQLRNSAQELLMSIAADMRHPQNKAEQQAKSLGNRPDGNSEFNQTAHRHADDRLEHGFGINALIAEYRALRASVLRRWQAAMSPDAGGLQEMIRFNEAIDQLVAESVRQHAQRTKRMGDLFAGALAHDLRSPLAAIWNSAEVLLRDDNLSSNGMRAAANVQRSSARMKRMIDDLFVFARTRLGDALPLELTSQDVGRVCRNAAAEVCAAFPDAHIDVRLSGRLTGIWDGERIGEMLVNLLTNAVKHGTGDIKLRAEGQEDIVYLRVSNSGLPIPASALPTLFDPLTRASPSQEHGGASGMGLGLYICRCIAENHDRSISVDSNIDGTVFTVALPRRAVAESR